MKLFISVALLCNLWVCCAAQDLRGNTLEVLDNNQPEVNTIQVLPTKAFEEKVLASSNNKAPAKEIWAYILLPKERDIVIVYLRKEGLKAKDILLVQELVDNKLFKTFTNVTMPNGYGSIAMVIDQNGRWWRRDSDPANQGSFYEPKIGLPGYGKQRLQWSQYKERVASGKRIEMWLKKTEAKRIP